MLIKLDEAIAAVESVKAPDDDYCCNGQLDHAITALRALPASDGVTLEDFDKVFVLNSPALFAVDAIIRESAIGFANARERGTSGSMNPFLEYVALGVLDFVRHSLFGQYKCRAEPSGPLPAPPTIEEK